MVIFNQSLGIDFRPNHLILTLLRKAFGKIRLVAYKIHPLGPEGQKEGQEGQWINLIGHFIAEHQINKERVFVSIPREKVVVRFLRLPVATKENLRKVIEYEAPKYTPFDKEEAHFDYQILGEDKEWLHLIVVFMKKEELNPYLSALKKIGIVPLSIQVPSVAALNLFFYHGEDKGRETVLLDVGEPFFEMNLIRGGEWRESFHLPLPAEKKVEKIIDTFTRSGLTEDSLSRAIFFVHGLASEKTLPALQKTRILNGVAPPPLDRIEAGIGESRLESIYASIGVPLKGVTQTRLDLNLLPLEMRKKVRQVGKPLFLVFLAVAIILSITWGMGVYSQHQNALEALRAEVKKRKPEIDAIEKTQKQKGELAKEIAEFEKITSGEVPKTEVLKELSQILPSAVWVWNIKFSAGEVEMSGFADSASDLIPLLDKSPLFEKVEFLAPVTKERERRTGGDKEKERFKIKLRLEGRRAGS
jgi:general secretion pathway protein L